MLLLLSMVLPFLALVVLWFVFRGQFARHKKIARVTLPFFFCMAAAIALVMVFPQLALFLPRLLLPFAPLRLARLILALHLRNG